METGVSDNFPTGRANIAQFHLTPRHGKGGSFLDRLSRSVSSSLKIFSSLKSSKVWKEC